MNERRSSHEGKDAGKTSTQKRNDSIIDCVKRKIGHSQAKTRATYNFYSMLMHTLLCCIIENKDSEITEDLFARYSSTMVKMLSGASTKKSQPKEESLLERIVVDGIINADNHLSELRGALTKICEEIYEITIKTRSRLAINLKSVYMPLEIGLAWHPFLNIPYIPSSSLKGALRANLELLEYLGKKELNEVFGSDRLGGEDTDLKASLVSFYDAFPTKDNFVNLNESGGVKSKSIEETVTGSRKILRARIVEPDVMTPHYREPDAVREDKAFPIPLLFFVVGRGVIFKSYVCLHEKSDENEALKRFIEKMSDFRTGLPLGLAAKTSVGYGDVEIQMRRIK